MKTDMDTDIEMDTEMDIIQRFSFQMLVKGLLRYSTQCQSLPSSVHVLHQGFWSEWPSMAFF
jgi:hypothetical protein